METRSMEITLISARDLKKRSIFSKTNAFAVAWISNNNKNRQWTPVDKENGTNPTWNQVMNFILNEADLQQGRLFLQIVIYRTATFGDKEIGRVSIPLNEFLKPSGGKKGARAKFLSYQVRKPSGKSKGVLDLSVKFTEKAEVKLPQAAAGSHGTAKPEVVTAYPVYPPAGCLSQPPPYPPANIQYPIQYPPPQPILYPPPYPPANNQYPQPQPMYPPPPPYHQSYHPPFYQVYPPYQGYSPNQGYPPISSAV